MEQQKPAAAMFGNSAAGGPREMRPVMRGFAVRTFFAYSALLSGSVDVPILWCLVISISQALSSTIRVSFAIPHGSGLLPRAWMLRRRRRCSGWRKPGSAHAAQHPQEGHG